MAVASTTREEQTGAARIPARRVPMARLQLAVLCLFLMLPPLLRGIDPDYWWHLRTGDLIVHGGIPRHDPFSWTRAGQPWVVHEWLSEALIYVLRSCVGYLGSALVFGAATCAALLLMYALARRYGAGERLLLLLVLLSTGVLANFAAVRPQVLTWLLFAMFVVVLERDDAGEGATLWALPLLMALWVNLHLGFVYGLLAVACWLAARVYGRLRGDARPLARPVVVTAACFVAVLANPAGPEIYAYPFRYLRDAHSLGIVSEWQRPNPINPLTWPFFGGIAVLAYTLFAKERPRPFLLLLTLAAIAIGLQAARNMPFAALLLPAVAGPALARRWPAMRRGRDGGRSVHPALAAGVLAAVALIFVGGGAARGNISIGAPRESAMPAGGAAYVAAHYPDSRLYNDYNWGGYLAYKRVPVFIDGRTDFYRAKIIDDYTKIGRGESGWNFTVDNYGIDVMLLRPESHLAKTMRGYDGWREVYAGSDSSVFVRESSH